MKIKKCSKCKKNKSLNDFDKNKNEKDGFHCHCKECKKKYRRKNNVVIKEWRTSHKDFVKEYNKKWREENLEKKKKSSKEWYRNNKEKVLSGAGIWAKENPEKRKRINKKYYEKNIVKIKEFHKEYAIKNKNKLNFYKRERMRNNLQVRFKSNIRCLIRQRLKKRLISKNGKSTFDFLPYTVNELKQHLENLFEPWMNWGNWGIGNGKWNIDHKVPDSNFNYKSVDDEGFQKCWALKNLRPLDAIENIKKSDKVIN